MEVKVIKKLNNRVLMCLEEHSFNNLSTKDLFSKI